MLTEIPKLGFYQHRITGNRVSALEFNVYVPNEDMENWDYYDAEGAFVSKEEREKRVWAVVVALRRLFGD